MSGWSPTREWPGSRRRTRRGFHAWTATAAVLASSACSGVQSALDPAGPAASAIANTWWVMAIGATAVLALVMGLLWFVLARQSERGFRHGTGLIVGGGIVLPVLTLVALLVHGTAVGRRVMAMEQPVDLVVEVVGRQWHWDFHYLGSDGGKRVAATTDVLVMPLDRTVEFRVTSADVIHSFWIPRLGGKVDAIPGRINPWRLRADTAGPVSGQCAEFCGLEHAHMRFDVVTLPAAQFDRWLAAGGSQPLPRRRLDIDNVAEPVR